MARVDYEGVVSALERKLVEGGPAKTSWGVRELRLLIADLRIEHEVVESPTDRIFRLFGDELADVFFNRLRAVEGVQSNPGADEDGEDRVAVEPRPELIAEAADHREAYGPEGSTKCLPNQQQRPPTPRLRLRTPVPLAS